VDKFIVKRDFCGSEEGVHILIHEFLLFSYADFGISANRDCAGEILWFGKRS